MATKQTICDALRAWIHQRPGLEFGNYGDVAAYRSESRRITRQLHDARVLLRAVELSGVTAYMLRAAFRAYSGRLTLVENADGSARLDYCTGQYWPTEYRAAACAVLASALWDYKRDFCMPSAIVNADGEKTYPHAPGSRNAVSAGDWLRTTFRREYGRHIAGRWFD